MKNQELVLQEDNTFKPYQKFYDTLPETSNGLGVYRHGEYDDFDEWYERVAENRWECVRYTYKTEIYEVTSICETDYIVRMMKRHKCSQQEINEVIQ